MPVFLGLGCDRNTSLATLKTAISQALALAKLRENAVQGMATIDKKNDEVAILQLAAEKNWVLQFFTAAELAKVAVPNPSETVLKYMGTPAVAEAASLLAAGVTMDYLLLEKHKYRGEDGKNATVSIAKVQVDKITQEAMPAAE